MRREAEGCDAQPWSLPAAFADESDAAHWSPVMEGLSARLDFLDRQRRFMGWSRWLAGEESLAGAVAMEIDRNFYPELESDLSTVALDFDDGSRIEQWLGDGNLMRSGEVEIPPGARRRGAARVATEKAERMMDRLIDALDEHWPEWRGGGLGWEPLSFKPEAWRARLFSEDELALWEAAELSKSAQAGKAPAQKTPRM